MTRSAGPGSDVIRMWLDDLRTPPDDSWTWVKTVADATALMEAGEVAEASLDHDLGEDVGGRDGRRPAALNPPVLNPPARIRPR